jgi:hypothetical protein
VSLLGLPQAVPAAHGKQHEQAPLHEPASSTKYWPSLQHGGPDWQLGEHAPAILGAAQVEKPTVMISKIRIVPKTAEGFQVEHVRVETGMSNIKDLVAASSPSRYGASRSLLSRPMFSGRLATHREIALACARGRTRALMGTTLQPHAAIEDTTAAR